MAHFRKVYSNSSSLSYIVPPRTTVVGIIAAVLGKERDSYYEEFNKNDCNIGVKINNKANRIMQSVNYLKINSSSEFRYYKEHTQVPFEILVGEDKVSFRVYFNHKNPHIMKELTERIIENKYVYPPFLGSAAFSCYLKFVDFIEKVEELKADKIDISSIVPSENIKRVFIGDVKEKIRLCKEKMVVDFNKNRGGIDIVSYIIEENGNNIKIETEKPVYKIQYQNVDENIVFM